jgi:hypothetical protein
MPSFVFVGKSTRSQSLLLTICVIRYSAHAGGFFVNHSTISGMCCSNEPGIERFNTPARVLQRFSKSCVTPPGMRTNEPRSRVGPGFADENAHGAFDHVKDVVLRMRMRARAFRMGLEPPFRNRIVRLGFGSVSLEDGRDASHRIRPSFAGTENYRLAGGGIGFVSGHGGTSVFCLPSANHYGE